MREPELGSRRVLVTGGGTGIGRAVVEAVLQGGGRVAIVGRRADVLAEVVRAHPPGAVVALPADLASPEDRKQLVSKAKAALGGLDGFVHSAGLVVHERLGHLSEEALRAQLEVNLVAPLRLGEEALSVLDDGGAMVFVASTLAERPVRTSVAYSAAKAGLLAAVKVLALEGAARGVRANAVSPGVVDTGMVRELRLAPGEAPPTPEQLENRVNAQLDALRALHPLGRLGTPADVAHTVLHLLRAGWVTGATWTLDGGLLLRE